MRAWMLAVLILAGAVVAVVAMEETAIMALDDMAAGGALGFTPSSLELRTSAENDIDPGEVGTGRFSDSPNFPGPQYGQPGYKESHNWEDQNDVDLVSPLIFDWEAYKLKYGDKVADDTEKAFKTDWLEKLESISYPNCRQGRKHDHPPGGFSLKLYYDANKAALHLGDNPKCGDIARQFLTEGVFSGMPLALGRGTGYDILENDGSDGNPPASSWLFCKWRRGAGMANTELSLRSNLMSGTASSPQQVYSRRIQPNDVVFTELQGAAAGFEPTPSYTISFWYRPNSCWYGEVINFGDSVNIEKAPHNMGRRPFFSPGVRQVSCTEEHGVKLGFQISTSGPVMSCEPNKDAPIGVSHILPYRKWTFVALTVTASPGLTSAAVFYDNQLSGVEKSAGGDGAALTDSGEIAEMITCNEGAAPSVPEMRSYGHLVSSYFPTDDSDHVKRNADVAGVTYYNKALSQTDLAKMYEFEQKGVSGWTANDAKGFNNGLC